MRLENHIKDMNEASSMELKKVIDQFVRFLIGDRKVALRELESLKKFSFPIPKVDNKEYNDLYGNLFKGLRQAIEKNMK